MKKMIFAALAMTSLSAFAGQHTITGGYAQTSVKDAYSIVTNDDINPKGINLKYGYEPDDSKIGIMTSLTITGEENELHTPYGKVKEEIGYGSLMGGVSYSVTDWAKPYALVGVARGAYKLTAFGDTDEETDTGFAYGAGVQFNPVSGFTVDAGVEAAKIGDVKTTTWVVGAGWRF